MAFLCWSKNFVARHFPQLTSQHSLNRQFEFSTLMKTSILSYNITQTDLTKLIEHLYKSLQQILKTRSGSIVHHFYCWQNNQTGEKAVQNGQIVDSKMWNANDKNLYEAEISKGLCDTLTYCGEQCQVFKFLTEEGELFPLLRYALVAKGKRHLASTDQSMLLSVGQRSESRLRSHWVKKLEINLCLEPLADPRPPLVWGPNPQRFHCSLGPI